MLTKIHKLVEELNANKVRYCHWKSNSALGESLAGQTDVDLLIHRKDANSFRVIMGRLCFKPAVTKLGESFPSMAHYYALDEESGVLIHVHAYFRVITGQSLAKNYRLPLEEMLLQNTREVDTVRLPSKSAELVVFTLRMMLKHTSLMELVLLARYWKQVPKELKWLLESDSMQETLHYVKSWLPTIDPDLFSECIAALKSPSPLIRRIMLGFRLRSHLRIYARHSAIRAWLGTILKFTIMFLDRLVRSQKRMFPQNGGSVVAFVGSEATGKSTLLEAMRDWLGEHFAVRQIHAGKPKSTFLTILPNLLVPILRKALPTYRSTSVETEFTSTESSSRLKKRVPIIFAMRSALLAYDRRSLLTRAFGLAANGSLVLCDRYPSLVNGAPDGPQLSHLAVSSNQNPIRRLFAQIETRLYREIPDPDLVIYLSAPLEVTVSRNANRGKREPEDYVRRRHARSSNLEFGNTQVHKINTNQPFEKTVLEVKKAIWNVL